MRRTLKTLIATSALVAGIAIAPALYAHGTEATPGTQVATMGQNGMGQGQGGMMGQGGMGRGQGGPMGQGGMGQGGMGQGQMGQNGMGPGQGGPMGQGGMGPGNMMAQMSQMMAAHGKMMETMMKEHGVTPPVTE